LQLFFRKFSRKIKIIKNEFKINQMQGSNLDLIRLNLPMSLELPKESFHHFNIFLKKIRISMSLVNHSENTPG
jgi:hypothetical protein